MNRAEKDRIKLLELKSEIDVFMRSANQLERDTRLIAPSKKSILSYVSNG